MNSLVLAGLMIVGYIVAYHTYGKYLARRIFMMFMIFMTGWAMLYNIGEYFSSSNWLLLGIGAAVFALELWMIVESVVVLRTVYANRSVVPGAAA